MTGKRISPENQNFFFGYYDKTPWNEEQTMVLAHHVEFQGRLATSGDAATVGIFKIDNGNYHWHPLAKTTCWNFQQGAMLQWIGNHKVIFNILNNGQLVSSIIDIKSNVTKILPIPVYALNKAQTHVVSTDFVRLQNFRPGYGYDIFKCNDNVQEHQNGLFLCNITTGHVRKLIDFSWFTQMGFVSAEDDFWVDHLSFSPQDQALSFFLRKTLPDGGVASSIFVLRRKDKEPKCILNTGMASHFDWYSDSVFSVWARKNKRLAELSQTKSSILKATFKLIRKWGVPSTVRRNIYQDKFLHININSLNAKEFAQTIPSNKGGGHFSFSKSREWMLNDTPADKTGARELMLYDLNRQKTHTISSLKSPFNIINTGWRCDLHPRWSPDNRSILVDGIHDGYRGLYLFDVSDYTCADKK